MTSNDIASITRPCLLADNLVENVWGGDWLVRMKGLPPRGHPIGESWEFSTHPSHPGELIREDGRRIALSLLVGEAPLLIKFIDACDNLSVQVHPSDAFARQHENSSGKSESWYIMETDPAGGYLYLGFNPGVQPAQFEAACRAGDQEKVLAALTKISVKAGEIYHVPPGTVHAIGRGVRLFEIQQSSGITYRVWDWNRRSRDLHLDKAIQVLNFTPGHQRVDGHRIQDPAGCYTADVVDVTAASPFQIGTSTGYSVVTVIAGQIKTGVLAVTAGRSFLVPGGAGVRLEAVAPSRVIISRASRG